MRKLPELGIRCSGQSDVAVLEPRKKIEGVHRLVSGFQVFLMYIAHEGEL